MTNTNASKNKSAPREIDAASLDQVVGAGVIVHDVRKQGGHQSDGVMVPDRTGNVVVHERG